MIIANTINSKVIVIKFMIIRSKFIFRPFNSGNDVQLMLHSIFKLSG